MQTQTYRIIVRGRVQGVGYRPFVYRLAGEYRLNGSVSNHGSDVHILAQGAERDLDLFTQALIAQAPLIARPVLLEKSSIQHDALQTFEILPSQTADSMHVHVPPDYFTCPACLAELHDPHNRRFAYPFINCTQCGPRYTIIKTLPYDRQNTSMADFTLCAACAAEYTDPASRRYHAEPVACAQCGPALHLEQPAATLGDPAAAFNAALELLENGEVISIKGIGGYHLCCDATNPVAIQRLRDSKPRPHKPLAVMFPQAGDDELTALRAHVHIDPQQAALLRAAERPVVLVTRHTGSDLPTNIAPGLGEIGVMLPYSPLHHLLLQKFGRPIIATSANISGEPVLTEAQAVSLRLAHITQHHLHHNRPIQRPADDSVWFINAGKPRPIRLGRGASPRELKLPFTMPVPMLACGGHMKNTVALAWSNRLVISPHIGDLDAPRSLAVFAQVIDDLQRLYQVQPEYLVCDAHPGYASTRWAQRQVLPILHVFHHHAHASCLTGEFPHEDNWLVFTWDGVGYGADGELWGGEALYGQPAHWQRMASWRPFNLPGGEKAAREPWRSALALAWACGCEWNEAPADIALLYKAWQQQHNCPATSAVGRLFDAAAALTGVCNKASFEGQAPMYLEHAAREGRGDAITLDLLPDANGILRSDWQPLVPLLMDSDVPQAERAYVFHATLAEALLAQANIIREQQGEFAIGLCGGVFQNRLLTDLVWRKLSDAGYRVYMPEQVPVNDGGLCYGQVVEAAAVLAQQHH